MEYLYGVLSNISRDLVCAAVNQLRYPCCFNTFVKELEEEEANLIATRDGVQDRIAHAKKQTKKPAKLVEKWLDDADIDVESVKQLLEEARTKHNRCFGHCPNWIWRYNLGKKLANKKKKLENFVKEVKDLNFGIQLERVATLPSGILNLSSEKYLSFESRQKAYEELMEAVKDDEVGMIGLYGMGGCGKTTMAEEVQKKAEADHLFDKVLFVPVSSTVEVRKIQDKIASSMQYTFPENEERERAQRLYKSLKQENKVLVILDDVWEKLDFDSIGIPSTDDHKGCKVLITTRSGDVCTLNDCQRKIQLQILTDEEAWSLFQKDARISEDTSDTVKDLARQISDECKGLPVAIAAVASTLKGKDEKIWKVALKRLKSSKPVNIGKGLRDPYKCLELSYDNLDDEAKSLLLLCSVFPEDYEIPIELLARCAIGLGVVGEVGSYEEARNEVIAAKIKLVSCCLLLDASDDDDECVKMHDIVRDVAHLIAKNENKGIKCAGENDLIWEQNSVRYLWCEKLPNDLDCSNLEFLYVTTKVEVFDESFTRVGKLRVLCLFNEGGEKLPLSTMSFKTLTNLRCLILSCWKLSDISFVRNMKKLESLSLNECFLPSFLDLQKDDAVAQLTKLKLLVLHECKMERNILEVIGRMPQLEELCIVNYRTEWDDCSENTIGVPQTLQRYTIVLGSNYDGDFLGPPDRTLMIRCFDISNEAMKGLAKKAKILYMGNIERGAKNMIPSIFELEGGSMAELNELYIRDSKEIECVVDSRNHTSEVVGSLFSSLKTLDLWDCPKLTSLLFTQVITPSNPVRYTIFQELQELIIHGCKELKYVFSTNTAGGLPQLKWLHIEECEELKYVFSANTLIRGLPQLKWLDLWQCDKVEQIVEDINGSGAKELEIIEENTSTPLPPSPGTELYFPKLKEIRVIQCHKLKRLFSTSASDEISNLKVLNINGADELEELIGFEQRTSNNFQFQHLKEVNVRQCHKLKRLFSKSASNDLPNLEILSIDGADELEELIGCEQGTSNNFQFQHLKKLKIRGCAKLEVIFPVYVVRCLELECLNIAECKELKHIMEEDENDKIQRELKLRFPKLKEVNVKECHKLKRLFSTSASNDLLYLEILSIDGADELEELIGCEQGASNNFQFQHLKKLKIRGCAKLEVIFPVYVVKCLPKLKCLYIKECKELKHIMEEDENDKIQRELKLRFPKLKEVNVKECHKLKRLFSTSASNDLPNLEILSIDGADELEEFIGCEQGASNNFQFQHLKTLEIRGCAKLEVIFPVYVVRCLELERLNIAECKELKHITEEAGNDRIQIELKLRFPKLEIVYVKQCHKLKRLFSTSASDDLPNLGTLIIDGAHELEELIGCEQREDEEIEKAIVKLPQLKILIFMHLLNLCQEIELRPIKHCIIDNCPKLSLTSTTTLQELRENISDSDFANLIPHWRINGLVYDMKESNKVSKSRNTSEFFSSQSNGSEVHVSEVHGSEVHATTTSTNSELNERLSLSPLDVCQHETHSQNIKISVEEGTASENAMIVSSHIESTSSQMSHKSYGPDWDSKPENTSMLQMNQEDPSTSKSKSPCSQVSDSNQFILGSIPEMVREHKQIQIEVPVSTRDEFLELERERKMTSHLQLLEQNLSFVSSPNVIKGPLKNATTITQKSPIPPTSKSVPLAPITTKVAEPFKSVDKGKKKMVDQPKTAPKPVGEKLMSSAIKSAQREVPSLSSTRPSSDSSDQKSASRTVRAILVPKEVGESSPTTQKKLEIQQVLSTADGGDNQESLVKISHDSTADVEIVEPSIDAEASKANLFMSEDIGESHLSEEVVEETAMKQDPKNDESETWGNQSANPFISPTPNEDQEGPTYTTPTPDDSDDEFEEHFKAFEWELGLIPKASESTINKQDQRAECEIIRSSFREKAFNVDILTIASEENLKVQVQEAAAKLLSFGVLVPQKERVRIQMFLDLLDEVVCTVKLEKNQQIQIDNIKNTSLEQRNQIEFAKQQANTSKLSFKENKSELVKLDAREKVLIQEIAALQLQLSSVQSEKQTLESRQNDHRQTIKSSAAHAKSVAEQLKPQLEKKLQLETSQVELAESLNILKNKHKTQAQNYFM